MSDQAYDFHSPQRWNCFLSSSWYLVAPTDLRNVLAKSGQSFRWLGTTSFSLISDNSLYSKDNWQSSSNIPFSSLSCPYLLDRYLLLQDWYAKPVTFCTYPFCPFRTLWFITATAHWCEAINDELLFWPLLPACIIDPMWCIDSLRSADLT